MLRRDLRLQRSQDFQVVRRHGKRWQDARLAVNLMPNELPHNRFGFVVSKRQGNAVTRNRIRRRLRAAITHLLPDLHTGYDVVVIAQQGAVEANYHQLVDSLKQLFQRAHVMVDQ